MILFIVTQWFLGLLSFLMIGGAAFLWHEWYQRSWKWDFLLQESFFRPEFALDATTGFFFAACALALLPMGGLPLIKAILKSSTRESNGDEDPHVAPVPTSTRRIRRPDGTELHVEFHGPPEGPVIIATHGWGLTSKEWNPLVRDLALDFRLILWGLAGLGQSTRPSNRDFSMEKLAGDLKAVLECAEGKPAFLMGHSIGGMKVLTFCRAYPATLGKQVGGLILTHTTPMNPVRTAQGASFFTAIEKGVLRPLMYATIALSPLLRMINFLSLKNGTAHLMTRTAGFAGMETWEEIDRVARQQFSASPAVLARGMLAMMRYSAIDTLASIRIPTLVVAGDRDTITKPVASELIHEGIPHAELRFLIPAKHMGLIEHHRAYAAEVRAFVGRVVNSFLPAASLISAKTSQ